jgi:NTE family protein
MALFDWLNVQKKKLFPNHPMRIGLALSGGATRGAAHIGVLQVLEREGIHPDLITGTSAGAIVGAAYASGMTPEEISLLFHQLSWSTLANISLRNHLGLFNTSPMEEFIESNIGPRTFNDLPIPLAVVACDISTGERVILNQGSVSRAVRASSAVPGLFAPVEIEDRMLVDGGVVDNLPVALAYDMGADYVIGVDIASSNQVIHKPANFMEVLMSADTIRSRFSLPTSDSMNCRIAPDTQEYSGWSFEHSYEMESAGRIAAELALPQLRKDLKLAE